MRTGSKTYNAVRIETKNGLSGWKWIKEFITMVTRTIGSQVVAIRDNVLNYILVGSRQFEWDVALMSVFIGIFSCIAYSVPPYPPNSSLQGRLSVIGVSIASIAFAGYSMLGLIADERARRRCASKALSLLWLARAATSCIANLSSSPIWIIVAAFCLFFAVKSAIAYHHNDLVMQGKIQETISIQIPK